jgi:hypothetical protein
MPPASAPRSPFSNFSPQNPKPTHAAGLSAGGGEIFRLARRRRRHLVPEQRGSQLISRNSGTFEKATALANHATSDAALRSTGGASSVSSRSPRSPVRRAAKRETLFIIMREIRRQGQGVAMGSDGHRRARIYYGGRSPASNRWATRVKPVIGPLPHGRSNTNTRS